MYDVFVIKRYFLFRAVTFLFILHLGIHAQSQHDSLYYKTFPNALTVRIYSVKDNTGFTLSSLNNASNITYRSNATTNLGIGVTYRNISANVSTGFGFLNNGIEERGKTTSFDFQFHFFMQHWISDLLILHYKGFYATPGSYPYEPAGDYYYRPDIGLNLLGLTAYHVQNAQRFSYRSAFNQNEWIKKSSGTLLYGGGVYFERINSKDSGLIPSKSSKLFPNFSDFHYISFGPGIGYAYTMVIKKHFYVLASAIINGNINFSTSENGSINANNTSFQPGISFKTAAGYGGNVWNISLSYAGNILWVKQAGVPEANTFPASEVRLTLARQIILKRPVPVVNGMINKIFGKEDY
jgi:hypothetical protein